MESVNNLKVSHDKCSSHVSDNSHPGQNKFVEPRLRFERDIGRRRILEILRAVANDGRIFEHGQQGKAWQEHVEQLNQQEIFQIGGKGALKVGKLQSEHLIRLIDLFDLQVGTAKEKFLEGLRAWKVSRPRMQSHKLISWPKLGGDEEEDRGWRGCAT